MFATHQQIYELTGLIRPSAQARWLAKRRYKFERRADRRRTISLRLDEMDRHTLSKSAQPDKPWRVDLSQFAKAG